MNNKTLGQIAMFGLLATLGVVGRLVFRDTPISRPRPPWPCSRDTISLGPGSRVISSN